MATTTDRKDKMDMRTEYAYINDGNTVRKVIVEAEPVREPERRKRVLTEEEKRRRQAKRDRIRGMDIFSVLFLCGAIAIAGIACVKYLGAVESIGTLQKESAKLEKTIVAMKEENRIAEDEVTDVIDLEHIYKVATKKLGMVHPKKDQVITYKSTKSDSVRQYGEIPSGTNESIKERILGK